MPRRIYAKGPAPAPRAPRANYIHDDWGSLIHVPDLTVFEAEPEWIETGILDTDGDMISYRVAPQPLGFFEFDEDGKPIL